MWNALGRYRRVGGYAADAMRGNRILTLREVAQSLAEALDELSPAHQAAALYAMQSWNGYPRDEAMEKEIDEALRTEERLSP